MATPAETVAPFALELVKRELGLTATSYERTGHNNYVFIVTLASHPDETRPTTRPVQSGTVPLPAGPLPTKLVVRIADPSSSIDVRLKPENEVAALALARSSDLGGVRVPDVYAWSAAEGAWMIMSFEQGIPLAKLWDDLDTSGRLAYVTPLAILLKKLQAIVPPKGYGGLRLAEDGTVRVAEHPLGYGGPYDTPAEYWKGMIHAQLKVSDAHPILHGWQNDDDEDLRARIERFADGDHLAGAVAQIDVRSTFAHNDITFGNILVSPTATQADGAPRFLAILDFEISHVAPTPLVEFLNGIQEVHHLHPGQHEEVSWGRALLNPGSFPAENPLQPEDDFYAEVDYALANAFDEALEKEGVQRPRTIKGAEEGTRLYWFAQEISQWWWGVERWEKRHDLVVEKAKCRTKLIKDLEYWGF